MEDIILTGIKPTGTPHLGNYFGAIKPAIDMSNSLDAKFYYFIANYHALNLIDNPAILKQHSYEVAATWLACGLDPNKVLIYKQSDIPETFELFSILINVTPKGLMNRAHAYKAKVEEAVKNGTDCDSLVNMGLYNYPILMAADILLFNATKIPVGLDQKQHCEMTRDIAEYFNRKFGNIFDLPNAIINKNVAVIDGLDGRKMSKSYGNTIPLFCDEKTLQKLIMKIVTDSSAPTEPKSTNCTIFNYYKLFATENEIKEFEQKFKTGIGWGDAKKELFRVMNNYLLPMREKYNYYISNPHIIDQIINEGSSKAKQIAEINLKKIRTAIGID